MTHPLGDPKDDPTFIDKNNRRNDLIEKEFHDGLTESEKEELTHLESWVGDYLRPYDLMSSDNLRRLKERYRENPDDEYSPGNFRRPTLQKCQEQLAWWADQGVNKLSDFNAFDMSPEEMRLEKIRWSEAKYYWDRYAKQLGRHTQDSYMYRKPGFSIPAEDAEDYGDFEPVSPAAARQYLYNFFTRQAERDLAGLPMQDVAVYPWKPRYDECVAMLGQEEVDRIEDEIFGRRGLELVRRNPCHCGPGCGCEDCQCRRNPLSPAHRAHGYSQLYDMGLGFRYSHLLRRNPGCPCGIASCQCGCAEGQSCTCVSRRNPDIYDQISDAAISYAAARPRRRRNVTRRKPHLPW